MNVVKLSCPNCSANLEVDSSAKICFCTYCGTKILLQNENETVVRNIDEARIKEAELTHDYRLKQLEDERARRQEESAMRAEQAQKINDRQKLCLITAAVVALFSLIFFRPGIIVAISLVVYALKKLPEKEHETKLLERGGIRFPDGLAPFTKRDVQTVVSTLESSGFTNITCTNLHDLKVDIMQKSGKINTIMVNGTTITAGGGIYHPDIPIVITYHGR